ncbi:putative glycoside hydrolase family 95 protein [Diaporthe ampelina]|uniref:Putative glycoside hydrolase family 95 protein n=1 Tax=Diaporthe ampelina TaxID=1214573 RepID=A0A0G2HDB4_9PEZI|nr:putative glycoside hydrolase family 95 protein [Diaporthe ampelina]
MIRAWSLGLLTLAFGPSLPAGKSLWSSSSATYGEGDDYILRTGYLLGNGKLGAIPFGPPGGNPPGPVHQYLPGIRDWIFQNGTGNISELLAPIANYGSYQTLGNLTVRLEGMDDYSNYTRKLDLDTGVHTTSWTTETGSLTITPAAGQRAVTVVLSAESSFDQTKGNAEGNYSFKGVDPGPAVEETTSLAATRTYEDLLLDHIQDYSSLMGLFNLSIPDTAGSSTIETSELVARYAEGTADPFLESLIPVFEYMAQNWAPRGSETAQLLYNGSGWVVHNEMNIFGYTGMKNDAQWANYPASAVWMMLHVFDHWDYDRNITWLTETGYPLLKGVASFWISQLQEDRFFNDGTLVVNPCNSAEQGPTTFGCTHYQQLIHQLLEAVLSTAPLASESDSGFLTSVSDALSSLDTGIHIDPDTTYGTGVLKEWKVPGSYLFNIYPQHRHISHLVGWYPGNTISGFSDGYSNKTLQEAVRASLIERGDGTSADGNGGNYGWPKVWRGACWARLNDSSKAHEELQLTLLNNVAPNLLSMYSGKNPPFQIDMNFGWAGNVLSMLVVDLPLPSGREGDTRTVVLGPAIPSAWGGGSVEGLRVRGGIMVDFEWDADGLVTSKAIVEGDAEKVRFVNVRGEEL